MDMDARNIEKQLDIELERCERSSRLLLKVMRTKTLARGLSLSLRLSLSLSVSLSLSLSVAMCMSVYTADLIMPCVWLLNAVRLRLHVRAPSTLLVI